MFTKSLKACLAGSAALMITTSAGFACDQYDAVVAAVQTDDTATATTLYQEILVSAACDDSIREWVGDYLARESFAAALAAENAEIKRQALSQALTYEKHWRSYAELGRMDWADKNYGPAAVNFQLAINELAEGDPTHKAEDTEIAELYQLASASLALADTAVELPKTRSGNTGGVFTTKIRGFTVEEVSLPITFEFDSTNFDAAGETYASALADHLIAMGANQIRLVGHTDPKGDEEYNLSLSQDRAAALAGFLQEQGLTSHIEIVGLGESELPPAPEGIEEGSEEHFRLARRVAFSFE